MAQKLINIGVVPNDGLGDQARVAGGKINDNFTELYALIDTLTDAIGNLPTSVASATSMGRLSLSSSQAITQADVAASGAIYYPPVAGGLVPIFDGSRLEGRTLGDGLSMSLDANTGHFGYHAAGFNYDVFAVYVDGETVLVTGPSWAAGTVLSPTPDIERSTGFNSTELIAIDGFKVNKNAFTARFGPATGDVVPIAEKFATYLGTIRPTANGIATDTERQRLVYNAFNQASRVLRRVEATGAWEWSGGTYRQTNNSALNQVEVLFGLDGGTVDVSMKAHFINSTPTPQVGAIGIGLDATSSFKEYATIVFGEKEDSRTIRLVNAPGLGFHRFTMLERGANASPTQQFFRGETTLRGQVTL